MKDARFRAGLREVLTDLCGRPTPLYFAERLDEGVAAALASI